MPFRNLCKPTRCFANSSISIKREAQAMCSNLARILNDEDCDTVIMTTSLSPHHFNRQMEDCRDNNDSHRAPSSWETDETQRQIALSERIVVEILARCRAGVTRRSAMSSNSSMNNNGRMSIVHDYSSSRDTEIRGEDTIEQDITAESRESATPHNSETDMLPSARRRTIEDDISGKLVSTYCHICSLYAKSYVACTNEECSKRARKIICDKCIVKRGWDPKRLRKMPGWLCTHCRKVSYQGLNTVLPFPLFQL